MCYTHYNYQKQILRKVIYRVLQLRGFSCLLLIPFSFTNVTTTNNALASRRCLVIGETNMSVAVFLVNPPLSVKRESENNRNSLSGSRQANFFLLVLQTKKDVALLVDSRLFLWQCMLVSVSPSIHQMRLGPGSRE